MVQQLELKFAPEPRVEWIHATHPFSAEAQCSWYWSPSASSIWPRMAIGMPRCKREDGHGGRHSPCCPHSPPCDECQKTLSI